MLHFYILFVTCAILTSAVTTGTGTRPTRSAAVVTRALRAGSQSPLSSAVCHALVNRFKIDNEAEGDRRQRASRGYRPLRRWGARPLRVQGTRYANSRASFGAGAGDSPAVGAGVDLAIGRP
jgi:hypothetical protein